MNRNLNIFQNSEVDLKINGGPTNINAMLGSYDCVILKPNKKGSHNVLEQWMVSTPHTKYVVKYDFNLQDTIIEMPDDSILEIDCGSLQHGTLVGHDTVLLNTNNVDNALVDITLDGTWVSGRVAADEEDITEEKGLLKFANKAYEPNKFSGLGRVYLRKNINPAPVAEDIWMFRKGADDIVYLMYRYQGVVYHIYDEGTGKGVVLKNNLVKESDTYNISMLPTAAQEHNMPYVKEGERIIITLPNGGRINDVQLNQTEMYYYTDVEPGGEGNILTKDMINKPNTIYIIQYDYNLNGETITIPANSVLQFEGGSLSNGTIIGNNCFIIHCKGALENIIIGNGITYEDAVVTTSIFKTWNAKDLRSACNLCPNGGTVVFDADFNYTTDVSVVVNKSITIDGCGKEIKVTTGNYRIINFITSTDCDKLVLRNLSINGNSSEHTYAAYVNEYLIYTSNVKEVTIDNCVFHNMHSDFNDWPERKYISLLYFYKYTTLTYTNNKIYDVRAPEGIYMFPHELEEIIPMTTDETGNKFINIEEHLDDYNKAKNYALIEGNYFEWNYVSSHLCVMFGRCDIRKNVFRSCVGSSINAFCYNSIIENNTFTTCMRKTGAVDLTEQDAFNFLAYNVSIRNNTAGRCGFFLDCYKGDSIYVENNVLDAYNEDKNDLYKTYKDTYPIDVDYALNCRQMNNYVITGNIVNNFTSLIYLGKDNKNTLIANNKVTMLETSARAVFQISSAENLQIIDNEFIGAPLIQWANRFFNYGVLHPVFIRLVSDNDRYIFKNITIQGNTFVKPNYTGVVSLIIIDVYNISNFQHLPHVENLNIVDNICPHDVCMFFVTDDINSSESGAKPEIQIRRNKMNVTAFSTSVVVDYDFFIAEGRTINISEQMNGAYNITHTGVLFPKGEKAYVKAASTDDNTVLSTAVKSLFISALLVSTAPVVVKSGWLFRHSTFVYFAFKDTTIPADFTDTDYNASLGVIKVGEMHMGDYNYIRPVALPNTVTANRTDVPALRRAADDKLKGLLYYNKDIKLPMWWEGNDWKDSNGFTPNPKKGTFAEAQALVTDNKITASDAGYEFYATDKKKPIYYGGDSKWYDATGTEVTV